MVGQEEGHEFEAADFLRFGICDRAECRREREPPCNLTGQLERVFLGRGSGGHAAPKHANKHNASTQTGGNFHEYTTYQSPPIRVRG